MKEASKLFREIIPVIIGILIALFINNWNEDRKDKRYLTQIFSSIESELEESLTEIEEVIPKQVASVDTLNHYLNNEKVTLYEIILKSDGLYMPSIKTNAWNSIANTKIELIEYEKLSALSDIVESKENLMLRVGKQMDFIFQNFENSDMGKKIIVRLMMIDIINAEKALQDQIEEFIKRE